MRSSSESSCLRASGPPEGANVEKDMLYGSSGVVVGSVHGQGQLNRAKGESKKDDVANSYGWSGDKREKGEQGRGELLGDGRGGRNRMHRDALGPVPSLPFCVPESSPLVYPGFEPLPPSGGSLIFRQTVIDRIAFVCNTSFKVKSSAVQTKR